MSEHKTIYAALAAAQAEMGRALKDSTNPHFRSKYADLASVMDACMPALNKHGIAVLQPAYDDETGRYVKTIFVHGASGESVECRVPLVVAKNDMQGYGSAATYARRYGLMGMAGIAPDDDDGNAASKAPPQNDGPDPQVIEAAKKNLFAAPDLDALKSTWADIPKPVQHVPAVINAKDARKAELDTQPAPQKRDDMGGDEIPYQ
jgi:hypothetical protein